MPFDAPAWERTLAPFRESALPQCWAYGAARAAEGAWQVERGVVTEDGRPIGAAQVMIRAVRGLRGGLAWIGRGPLWRSDGADGATLLRVLAALRRHYVAERGLYLRVAPPLALGAPEAARLDGAGFRLTGTPGWASAIVDLRAGSEALRAGLAQKWRNALNKAERLEVTVERGSDDAACARFIDEYRGFLAARGFATTVTPELLGALARNLPRDSLACYRASHGGAPLGSALIVRHGDTAEYLAGTLLAAGRGYNVGQLLLWRALCDARADGLARFDVGGMDPRLTPKGIYEFKQGLGGTPYRHVNEIEADNGRLVSRLVRWRVRRARASAQANA